MERSSIEELRRLSRALFGQTYRAEVMVAIAQDPDGLVTLTDLAVTLDLTTSNVQGPLRSLVEAGLLSDAPSGDSRRRFYIRNKSRAWDWVIELAQAARDTVEPLPHTMVDQPRR